MMDFWKMSLRDDYRRKKAKREEANNDKGESRIKGWKKEPTIDNDGDHGVITRYETCWTQNITEIID